MHRMIHLPMVHRMRSAVVHHVPHAAVRRLVPELHRIKHSENHRGVRKNEVANDRSHAGDALGDLLLGLGDESCLNPCNVQERQPRQHIRHSGRHVYPGAPFRDTQEVGPGNNG